MEYLAPQDENAPFAMNRSLSVDTKRSFGTPLSTVTGGKENPGSRKVLGNITNKSQKTPLGLSKSRSAQRRTLGDITNAGTPLVSAPPKSAKLAVEATPHESMSLADKYAEDGVEQLAGKSSRELEVERLVAKSKEIEERVSMFTAQRAEIPLPFETNQGVFGTNQAEDFGLDDTLEFLNCPSSPPPALSPFGSEEGKQSLWLDLDAPTDLPDDLALDGEMSIGINFDVEESGAGGDEDMELC